jgi:phenylacetate-CoA ligase
MLIIRGVNLFPSQIEELILAEPRLSPHYVLEVRREGRLDALDVVAEARPEAAGEAARAAVARELQHHVKERFGVAATVKVQPPGSLERSLGKAKRIIDLRPKG